MRVALLAAALGLAVLAAGCGGHGTTAGSTPCVIRMDGLGGVIDGGALFAELPDGSIVVGASHTHHSKLEVVLRRVTSGCQTVSSFGKSGTLTLTVEHAGAGGIDAMAATRDGRLLLAGNDGPHELVGRILGSGKSDPAFGAGGWVRFRPRMKNPFPGSPSWRVATSIAVSPSGSIFLGGDDDTAHCCTTDYVSELTADGAVVKRFGDGGTVVVPKISGSYVTQLSPNDDGSVVAFVEYEQSGCGYPEVVRMRPDGALDQHFDATVARTLKQVVSPKFRFSPSLVPGRSAYFALVGSYDETCELMSRRPPSGGLAIGIAPTGKLDASFGNSGKSVFAAPLYAFDIPPAIRLASGEIVAVGSAVQFFTRSGARGHSVKIARSLVPRGGGFYGLLPRPAGGVWVVSGSRKEIELIPAT